MSIGIEKMTENEIKKMIEITFKDKISAILLKYSNLTQIQYETLIINHIAENLVDNKFIYKNRALLRSKKVSRGSYSRTLQQAKKNIRSSIFTLLLLSYVGMFDDLSFGDYQMLSDKLREFSDTINNSDIDTSKYLIRQIERELLQGIDKLSVSKSIK
jgi:hypothetical protein